MKSLVSLGLVLALLAGCSSAGHPDCASLPTDVVTAAAEANGPGSYRLGPGDRIRLTVFRQPDLSGQFAIDGEGYLALPLIGEIPANGLSVRSLESAIAQRFLEEDLLREPRVAVEVLTHRSIYVLGEVNKPGEYEYQSGMNVINAVALAGGYTYRANSKQISIRRAGCTMAAGPATQVGPGEIITVQERFF